jgi:hypothetical protein
MKTIIATCLTTPVRTTFALWLLLLLAMPAQAEVVMIVNASNTSTLDSNDLKRILMGRLNQYPPVPVRPCRCCVRLAGKLGGVHAKVSWQIAGRH